MAFDRTQTFDRRRVQMACHLEIAVESLTSAISLAGSHVRDGSADATMVLAYNVAGGNPHALPGGADGTAAALLPTPAGATGTGDLGSASDLVAALSALHRDTGAVDAVRHWPVGTRTGAPV